MNIAIAYITIFTWILERKSVADTPLKKQVANPIWHKQERARFVFIF